MSSADTGIELIRNINVNKSHTCYEINLFFTIFVRDGSVKFWKNKKSPYEKKAFSSIVNAHSRDVESVEEYRGIIFTGSADGSVKSWKPDLLNGLMPNEPISTYRCNDRIWSLALDPSGQNLAIGSAGNYDMPLHIFDSSL